METRTEPTASPVSQAVVRPSSPWITVLIVGVLIALFGVLAFTAIMGKSATFDEPLHAVGGMVHRYRGDFRINPEDPALFGWWASLPHGSDAIPLHSPDAEPYFGAASGKMAYQWSYVIESMYANGGAAADTFLNTSRFMFVLLGMVLAAMIALWAYQLGGRWAAIAAATLFCLDPNFLGHSALVKNDVPLSLLMCGLCYTLWRFGRDGGWHWLVLAAAACGMSLNVKFSGVLFGPMFVLLLLGRAMIRRPWVVLRVRVDSVWKRAGLIGGAALFAIAVSWAITWAVYGFRYNATADGAPLSSDQFAITSVSNAVRAEREKQGRPITDVTELERLTRERLPADSSNVTGPHYALPVSLNLWMQTHHILPEGWLFGFLYTYVTTLIRSAYLLGQTRIIGWWYYFPLAMAFKTPTATLAAAVVIPLVLLIVRKRATPTRESTDEGEGNVPGRWWTVIAVALSPCMYFGAALTTNLNLGLRHILPVYPFIFVALGCGFAAILRRNAKLAVALGGLIALGLSVETLAAYPDYLAFFNAPSGGSRGGLRLLGDSNLDWGQDLSAVTAWQKRNPQVPVYFAYFGTAKPDAYQLNYTNMTGGYNFKQASNNISGPGMLVLSATNVQGIYWPDNFIEAYLGVLDPGAEQLVQSLAPGPSRHNAAAEALRHVKPTEVLNGTIYLYQIPPQKK